MHHLEGVDVGFNLVPVGEVRLWVVGVSLAFLDGVSDCCLSATSYLWSEMGERSQL